MATLDLTIGALEVGILIATVLYGVATVQAYLYVERSFKDPIWLRGMVGLVWTLETVHTVFTWILLYSLTVTNYGRPSTINDAPWFLALTLPLTSCLGAIVQAFFAYRVRILSGRLIIPICAWSGALLRLAFGITLGVVIIQSKTITDFLAQYEWLAITQFILSAVVDVLNTASLCVYLLRNRSEIASTRRIVDKLVTYTVETGLITSLCAVAIFACNMALRHTLVHFSLFMLYPKLFSNSFFTTLNARRALRRADESDTRELYSTGVFTQDHSDPENRAVALELSSRQTEFSMATPARMLSPPFNFEDTFAKSDEVS